MIAEIDAVLENVGHHGPPVPDHQGPPAPEGQAIDAVDGQLVLNQNDDGQAIAGEMVFYYSK